MTVKLAPDSRRQYLDSNGDPYAGAKLFYYAADTTTKLNTYTTSAGTVANRNPIILDASGRTPYGVWLTAGLNYKEVLAPSTDTDPPTSPIFTEDYITGINDTSAASSQWTASGSVPTYVSGTQFTVPGDASSTFPINRRIKATVTAGTVYGYISVVSVAASTTVTVVLDSGALDSGLSTVEVGVLTDLIGGIPQTVAKKNTANTFTAVQTMSGASIIDANATVAANATTAAVWLLGNYVTLTGTATVFTDVADAPQAGAEVEIYCNAAHTFTNNGNFIVDGGADFVAAAGDRVLLRAKSTSVFTVHPRKLNGQPVVPGLALISTTTASNSATIDIETTFNSTYDKYVLEVTGLIPQTNSTQLRMRMKLGGAYDTAANYDWVLDASTSTAAGYTGEIGSATTSIVIGSAVSSNAGEGINFTMKIYSPSSTTTKKSVDWNGSQPRTSITKANGAGKNSATTALTGLRFYMSSDNITSGTFRLYGIANS